MVGELGRQYLMRKHVPIEEKFQFTVQNPTFSRARWIAETLMEKFQSGELDEIQVIYHTDGKCMPALLKVCTDASVGQTAYAEDSHGCIS